MKYKPMAVVDGVILAMSLVPFMVTNLKAPIDPEGPLMPHPVGAAATEFRRPANTVEAPTDRWVEVPLPSRLWWGVLHFGMRDGSCL